MKENSLLKTNRLVYFDWLRIIATFAVVVIHCSVKDSFEINSLEWGVTHCFFSLSQWAVPAFVMISGALFLGKDIELGKLFKHNILRIATAFLFWSILYASWRFFITHEKNTIREFLLSIIRGNYHMWFLFLIVGLYLVAPILNVIAKNKKIAVYFVLLAFIFSFLFPQAIEVIGLKYNGPSLILSEIYSKFRVELVLGYSGYFVLGYLIKEMYIKKKHEIFIYLLGICGVAITVFASAWLEKSNIASDVFTDEMSVNVLLMSVAVFVFAKQHLNKLPKSEKTISLISFVSKCTFGVYLVHPLVIDCLNRFFGVTTNSFNPILSIPAIALLVFACSLGISAGLNKIPFVKKWFV